MKVEILLDKKLIAETYVDDHYYQEFEKARNTLSTMVGIRLGEIKPEMDRLLQAVYMITKHGWSVERVRKDMWGR